MEDFGVSVCIATNAAKINKTTLELHSLYNAIEFSNLPVEIIVCGDSEPFANDKIIVVDQKESAHNGKLALLRNKAAEVAKYNILLFVDDDFIFPPNWFSQLFKYTKENEWSVLTTRILLPDGSRFWDRAQISPHKLLDYNHNPNDPNLYITGGFWLIKRSLYDVEPWDSNLGIYATSNGAKYNEDVDLSIKMHKRGVPLLIDADNYVWHWDEKYAQRNHLVVLRKDYKDLSKYSPSPEFQSELKVLLDSKNKG